MTFFKRWNNITGWVVFAIAAIVYLMTMEPVSSLWDCSEFIATSYKLEVGHPPGAPLFMMLARLATLFTFGNPDYVGIAVNAMNSLASAFCILFLFWTITHLARRMMTRRGGEPSRVQTCAALGAGAVGALAYTFTDTFWFSAIEGEVYALSSMFTALVVWLMLKWEEQADQPHASRWIVLIAYLMGLSIGVHILNLLTIPTLAFIYYFRTTEKVTFKGVAYTTLIACAILLFVNNIIIPYTVWLGAQVDTLFVNTFGLPANSGMVVEVRPEDLPGYAGFGKLAVMEFQKDLERTAWLQGGMSQVAPAQRMADFVNRKLSAEVNVSSYTPGLVASPLHFWLPDFVAGRLSQAFVRFGKTSKGFLTNEANLIGVETRTSSPVRILRDADTLQHVSLPGLFPCGEGAGYAGGIVSAAIDGERCAEMLADYIQKIR